MEIKLQSLLERANSLIVAVSEILQINRHIEIALTKNCASLDIENP